ncbi:CAMK protein kinase [Capronia coronata CBS 617.96]|uniref:CAMK protein kinase n=1 Tax=Capronia coronata CBS 617.96 TaxID=1182541 RepID=W9Y3U4_9EURO|nr:CAMK protein kinase [Capronia coronata CBS 617.96]EXJ83861.1 CAMK protein kinase [Capronia coronata CBS 617.96]
MQTKKSSLDATERNDSQYVLNDPRVSKRHVSIYTVVYEKDEPNGVDTLVYAEDLSQNGTYLNGDFIGKGNGGFLLSDGNILRLSRWTSLIFHVVNKNESMDTFDVIQEKEMGRFRRDYVVSDRLLGAGAFGKVFMALEQTSRTQVACKIVDLRKLTPKLQTRFRRSQRPATADDVDNRIQARKVKAWGDQKKREIGLNPKLKMYFREVEILSSISHPNIIGLEKVYITNNTIYMMQDIVTAGDLFSYIESKNGKLLEVEAAVIVRQMLIAVRFLHQNNIVHRDIKPDNILMTSLAAGSRVVLTDFGAARRIHTSRHRMSTVVGTHEYAAPEMLRRRHDKLTVEESDGYTRAVDMWAVGCVAVILLTGGMAFTDPATGMYSEKLARDCDLDFLRTSKDWQAVRQRPREFVERLLVIDEESRMTADEALQHPWFCNEAHKYDFEALYQRTIQHWHPRRPKSPVIDFRDGGAFKYLAYKWGFESFYHKSRAKGRHSPVEPPYKPFPRKMHLTLWPERDEKKRLSLEVLTAISKWSPQSAMKLACKSTHLSGEEVQGFITEEATDSEDYGSTRAKASRYFPSSDAEKAGIKQNGVLGKRKRTTVDSEERDTRRAMKAKIMIDEPLTRETGPSVVDERAAPLIPNALYDTTHWRTSRKSPLTETEDVLPSIETPAPTNKLKRRASTSLTGQRWTKRRGSIFDLAEDGDGDGGKPPKPTAAAFVENRPNESLATTFKRPDLYLPR